MKKWETPSKIFVVALILAMVWTMLGGLPAFVNKVEASPGIIYVPDNYPTIQAAVNAASPGDTIIVRDGTYTENVNANKDHLTIQSENGPEATIIQAATYSDVCAVTADYANIRGFTVTGGHIGIHLSNTQGCQISENLCTDNYWGIRLDSCQDITLTRNDIHYSGDWGIYLSYCSGNTIKENDSSLNGAANIRLDDSNNNVVENNNCSLSVWNGIILAGSNNNTIKDNICSDNDWSGIDLSPSCSQNTLRGNTCSGNGHYGILIAESSNNVVTNNTCIHNAMTGIWLRSASASDNTIYLNDFIDNAPNAVSDSSTNTWNSPEQVTYAYNGNTYTSYLGNHWDDYTGNDADGDGIGDTPYPIDSDADNYPLMGPFENGEIGGPTNQPPIASFAYSPYEQTSAWERNPAAGESITFDASSSSDPDGMIVDYIWDLEDIGSRTGIQTEIDYPEAGEYAVTLTVVDNDGATDSVTKTVKVVPEWRRELRVGDILFDSDPLGGLGHAGIYCGYGLTVEATGDPLAFLEPGVIMKSLESWDPKDMNPDGRQNVFLIRVRCTDEIALSAVAFAQAQLGKDYWLSWLSKNCSTDQSNWYCSELVWAAYYNQGIDIEYTPDDWAVSPLEIYLEACLGEKTYIVSQHGEPPTVPAWGGLFILALCPVDIQVTDPEGLTVSTASVNIPGCIYMIDDINEDGSPDDAIYIPEREIGDYLISVIPEPGASSTDTYSLEVSMAGVTITLADNAQIGDIPSQGYTIRSTETEIIQIVQATIDFDPDTLTLLNKGRVATVYIELPSGYDVGQIDVSSIKLNDTVPALDKPTKVGDYDDDGIPDLMVKFDMSAVQAAVDAGESVEIVVTGEVDGIGFQGTDTIRVINA
jgi:parallel beta-helix repeat protein